MDFMPISTQRPLVCIKTRKFHTGLKLAALELRRIAVNSLLPNNLAFLMSSNTVIYCFSIHFQSYFLNIFFDKELFWWYFLELSSTVIVFIFRWLFLFLIYRSHCYRWAAVVPRSNWRLQSVEPHVSHVQDQVRHCVWSSEGLFAYLYVHHAASHVYVKKKTNQIRRTLLEKQRRAHKWCTPMDPHIWPSKSRTTS